MKLIPSAMAVGLAVVTLAICGCGKPPAPSAAEESLPTGHRFTAQGRFLAVDLDHGSGGERAAVQRTWIGLDTLNTHFGPGWCDLNDIRLMHIAQDRVAVLRGGIGWRLARREGEAFLGDGGEKIRKSTDGWTLETSNGQTLQFDSRGRLMSAKDPFGTVWQYTYDDKGRLRSVGDGPENALLYHYDAARSRVIRVDGPEGLRLEYQYDAEGRLMSVVNAWKVKVEYQYDKAGELVSARDQFSQRITLDTRKPAPEPKPAAKAEPPKSPAKPSPAVQLMLPQVDEKTDARGLLTEKDVDGRKTQFGYDAHGRVESVASPEGRTTLGYDRFGRPTAITGTDGVVTRLEYNNLDLPVRVVQPDGAERKLTYNEHGFLTREETAASDWTAYEYDAQGRVSVVRQAPSSEERYAYDERGRLARVAYSGGREVRYSYDDAGNRAAEEWSTGERRQWAYDDQGHLTGSVDAAGLKTRYTYDRQGRIAAIEDPIHGKTTFQHSDSGLEWSLEKEGQGRTVYAMSPAQLPVAITSPSGQKTLFQYNPRSALLAVVTPSCQAWRYVYDPADRLARILSPDGSGSVFSRDKAGRLVAATRGGVVWRQYAYDAQGRLAQESSPAGLAAAYEYDAAGRLKAMRLPEGVVTFSNDPSGLKKSTAGPDYKVEEESRSDGSLARRVYEPAKLDLRLPQDKQGRPAGIELNGLKVTYGYSGKGLLERIVLPDGRAIRLTSDEASRPAKLSLADALEINVAYDRADRITAIEAASKAGQSVLRERYAYDPAGNLVGIEETSGATRRLQYDAEDRLVKATSGQTELAFGYDVAGNLISLASAKGSLWWTFDKVGRPVRFGPLEYTWDAGGNLALTRSGDARAENTFDAASRLMRRTVGGAQWRFGYLPSGDRLWREGPAGRSWYAYLASGLVGFKDEQGATWLVVHMPGTDLPLALCGSNGQTLLVAADRLHSVRRLVDASGKVTASADYGPFGILEAAQGDQKLAEYAGMLVDASGLYYARQRYYDPALARFISIDPIIGSPDAPASLHAYAYAANNPYRYRDPSGMSSDLNTPIPPLDEGYFSEYGWKSELEAAEESLRQGRLSAEQAQRLNEFRRMRSQLEEAMRAARTYAERCTVDA